MHDSVFMHWFKVLAYTKVNCMQIKWEIVLISLFQTSYPVINAFIWFPVVFNWLTNLLLGMSAVAALHGVILTVSSL